MRASSNFLPLPPFLVLHPFWLKTRSGLEFDDLTKSQHVAWDLLPRPTRASHNNKTCRNGIKQTNSNHSVWECQTPQLIYCSYTFSSLASTIQLANHTIWWLERDSLSTCLIWLFCTGTDGFYCYSFHYIGARVPAEIIHGYGYCTSLLPDAFLWNWNENFFSKFPHR